MGKLHVKAESGKISKQSTTFHLFLWDSGGCRKWHLIETIFHEVSKVFLDLNVYPAKPRIILLAQAGISNEIHSGFYIPRQGKLFPLNGENKAGLRNKYSEEELVVIDEVWMVSSKLSYQVHKRLNQILSPGLGIPFGRKSVF